MLNRMFGDFLVLVDPWEVDYGTGTLLDGMEREESNKVEVGIQFPPDEWAPDLVVAALPCSEWT